MFSTSETSQTGPGSRDCGTRAREQPASVQVTIRSSAHPPLDSGGIVRQAGCETAPTPSPPDAAACRAAASLEASARNRNNQTNPRPGCHENSLPGTATMIPEIYPPESPEKFSPSPRPPEPSASVLLRRSRIPSTNEGNPPLKRGNPSR